MKMTNTNTKRRGSVKKYFATRTGKRAIFYTLICALPVLQFCIFTFYINFNSIAMAFETYNYRTDGVDGIIRQFAGTANFNRAWEFFMSSGRMIANSALLFASNILITIPLALIFSYYLCKKCMLSGFFKVILYMPNIVSPMIFALLFKNVMNYALPAIFKGMPQLVVALPGKLVNQTYAAILFFNIWVSFGVNVLMFTGAMSGINSSVVESAQLDGANVVQEFLHIYVPMIFSTVSAFVILGMTGIFTNQMNLYTFYEYNTPAKLETMGYYLYKAASRADYINVEGLKGYLNYPQLAALGLILTLFVAPTTFLTRKLFDKYGPSED